MLDSQTTTHLKTILETIKHCITSKETISKDLIVQLNRHLQQFAQSLNLTGHEETDVIDNAFYQGVTSSINDITDVDRSLSSLTQFMEFLTHYYNRISDSFLPVTDCDDDITDCYVRLQRIFGMISLWRKTLYNTLLQNLHDHNTQTQQALTTRIKYLRRTSTPFFRKPNHNELKDAQALETLRNELVTLDKSISHRLRLCKIDQLGQPTRCVQPEEFEWFLTQFDQTLQTTQTKCTTSPVKRFISQFLQMLRGLFVRNTQKKPSTSMKEVTNTHTKLPSRLLISKLAEKYRNNTLGPHPKILVKAISATPPQ